MSDKPSSRPSANTPRKSDRSDRFLDELLSYRKETDPNTEIFLHETFAGSRIEFLQSAEIYLLSCTDVSVGQTKDYTTTSKIS
tara:strand:+ start:438 stop:686 length:249 start_codon:yes stop_codon:yes gene_type:complete